MAGTDSGEMGRPVDFSSSMTPVDLEHIRRSYWFTSDIRLRVPGPKQRVLDRLEKGAFFYEESFKAGLRLPIHPVVLGIMNFYGICPTMVTPNSWRHIIGFISMCALLGATATVPLFRACYSFTSAKDSGWSYIGPRKNFKRISKVQTSIKGWKS